MSKTDGTPSGYTLHVDRHEAVIVVRGPANAKLLGTIIHDLTEHADFHLNLPSMWDMRESVGFGEMSRAELSHMVMTFDDYRTEDPGDSPT